jgi:branched-subunit amino acid transport protein
MSVWLTMLSIGSVSALLRVVPLLSDRHLTDRVTFSAGIAGLSVIVGLCVRAVAEFSDPGTPLDTAIGGLAVVAGLALALAGRGVVIATLGGFSVYLVAATALGGLG